MAPSGTRVYVGNLPTDVRTREVEDLFRKFGRIRDVDLKSPSRPPAFAFVDFEDARDAAAAIDARDGYEYEGQRLRVEHANAPKGVGGTGGGRNERGSGEYAVELSHLPPRMSWQDLKDHMRKAGDVSYVSVDGYGRGYVEFSNRSDMKYAIDRFDDKELRNRGDKAYIRVKPARRGGRSRSRSRGHSRSRSRSRSPRSSKKPRSRKHSRSRSRSASRSRSRSARRGRSPSRSRSRSASRSRSRSPRKSASKKSRRDDGGKRSVSASKSPSPSPKGDRAGDAAADGEAKESAGSSNGKDPAVASPSGTDPPSTVAKEEPAESSETAETVETAKE